MKRLIDFLKGKNTTGEMRRVLLSTLICVVVCACMLMGGTLAWYYTSVEVGDNVIEIGVPDINAKLMPYGSDLLSVQSFKLDSTQLPKGGYYLELTLSDTEDDLGVNRREVYVTLSFTSTTGFSQSCYLVLNETNNYTYKINCLTIDPAADDTADADTGAEVITLDLTASWIEPVGIEKLEGAGCDWLDINDLNAVEATPEPSESPEPSETPAAEETPQPSETPLETVTPVPDDEDDVSATSTPEATAEPTATPELTPEQEDTPEPTDTAAPVDDGAATPTDEPADDVENENSDQ